MDSFCERAAMSVGHVDGCRTLRAGREMTPFFFVFFEGLSQRDVDVLTLFDSRRRTTRTGVLRLQHLVTSLNEWSLSHRVPSFLG